MPDDVVSQTTEDERGRMWLGTNRGLAVLEADEVNNIKRRRRSLLHPLLINRADGLISEECTIVPPVRMADGRMAFATHHGFAMLREEDFNGEKTTPPVFNERVMANGREVVIAKEYAFGVKAVERAGGRTLVFIHKSGQICEGCGRW